MADRAFVVGLSGVPGAGKTTLTQRLLQDSSQAYAVYYDQYQTITRMTGAQVRDWFARGGDPNEFALSDLIDELTQRTQVQAGGGRRPLVLFETPFGRLHRATGAFIDFLVWVDTPLDVALSRAVLAFLDDAQRNGAPNAASDFIRWQRQYMLNYPLVRAMYVAQRESILSTADLVLDGSKSPDDASELVRKALAARGVETQSATRA
jgi:uridine kinase